MAQVGDKEGGEKAGSGSAAAEGACLPATGPPKGLPGRAEGISGASFALELCGAGSCVCGFPALLPERKR